MPDGKNARYLVIVDDKSCEFDEKPNAEAEYERLFKSGGPEHIQLCVVRVIREAKAGLSEVAKKRQPRKPKVTVAA